MTSDIRLACEAPVSPAPDTPSPIEDEVDVDDKLDTLDSLYELSTADPFTALLLTEEDNSLLFAARLDRCTTV